MIVADDEQVKQKLLDALRVAKSSSAINNKWDAIKDMYKTLLGQKDDSKLDELEQVEQALLDEKQCPRAKDVSGNEWILRANPELERLFHTKFVQPILLPALGTGRQLIYFVGPTGIGKDEAMRSAAQYINAKTTEAVKSTTSKTEANLRLSRVFYAEAVANQNLLEKLLKCVQDTAAAHYEEQGHAILYLTNADDIQWSEDKMRSYPQVRLVLDVTTVSKVERDALLVMSMPGAHTRRHFLMRALQKQLTSANFVTEEYDGIEYKLDSSVDLVRLHAMIDEFESATGPSAKYAFALRRVITNVGEYILDRTTSFESRRGVYEHEMTFDDMTAFIEAIRSNSKQVEIGNKKKWRSEDAIPRYARSLLCTFEGHVEEDFVSSQPQTSCWVASGDCLSLEKLRILRDKLKYESMISRKQTLIREIEKLKGESIFMKGNDVTDTPDKNQVYVEKNKGKELDRIYREVGALKQALDSANQFGVANKLVLKDKINTEAVNKKISELESSAVCQVATDAELIQANFLLFPTVEDVKQVKKQWQQTARPSSLSDAAYESYLFFLFQ